MDWPGVDERLHRRGEEQDHTGAAEGGSALFLLLHRVTGLQVWIHKPQRESVGVFSFQTDHTEQKVGDILRCCKISQMMI